MSFREKSAWITLISLLLVSAVYSMHAPWSLRPEPGGFAFHWLVVCVVALVLIEIVGHVAIAVRAPREALAPADERERLIDLKATRIAAYVYVVGSFAAVAMLHLGANAIGIAYGVLCAFVVAEIVNYVARVIYYRRGP